MNKDSIMSGGSPKISTREAKKGLKKDNFDMRSPELT